MFSQNVCKNSLIVNTILETQSQFDVILIQESPWLVIHKIPSSLNSKGDDLVGTIHHLNQLLFTHLSMNRLSSPRVLAYINIHLSLLRFSLRTDIINHSDILLIFFINAYVLYFILNVYSDSLHLALKYLKDTEVNIDNVMILFLRVGSKNNSCIRETQENSIEFLIQSSLFYILLSMIRASYCAPYSK